MIDPKLSVQTILRDGWDPANTSNLTPQIHTGWFDERKKEPQITITAPDTGPSAGGTTGIAGIDPGGGPVLRRSGMLTLTQWAHREMAGMDGVNPKALTFQMVHECIRILLLHTEGVDDLEWVSPGNDTELPPLTDRQPTIFRYTLVTRFGFHVRR